ncbi:NADAR domain-containing protein [Verrucomicrobium sp. BvORR034]|uniref:NADAR family protein n=1 Tax=Verrucomicrobium sp. BvORR034 TaxID=1396418 RepID=UPI00067860C3|nr:NADAR domain-containing protein [Verrucomicrobium sp. BvORR034]
MEPILFYSTKGTYGAFSNFSAHPFVLNNKRWPTTEHYFQAQKFAGTAHEEAIRMITSPMVAARMGRSRQRPLRNDSYWADGGDGSGKNCLGILLMELRDQLRTS